jgi:hypothetical protein
MPFIVVYDANALVGNSQRDLLFRVARVGLVQAKSPSGSSTRLCPLFARAAPTSHLRSWSGCES